MGDMHCNLCGMHLGLADSIREHYLPKAALRKVVEKLEQEAARWEVDTGVFSSGYRSGIMEAVIAINEVRGK